VLAALPLVRWRGAESLCRAASLRSTQNGGLLFNPHVFNVEDGADSRCASMRPGVSQTCYEPGRGLLNQAKLRGWAERKR